MSDVRKQAERLVELESKAKHNGGDGISREEWLEISDLATSGLDGLVKMSRAYLAECEAHERTRERLAQAETAMHKIRGYTSNTTAFDDDYVRIAAEETYEVADLHFARIEQKEDSQDA